MNSTGTSLLYCGYIGGDYSDYGYGLALDGSGNAYATGETSSTQATFPVLSGPDLTHNGGKDAFVAKVNPTGTSLLYSGYVGGSDNDLGYGIAVDGSGNAYITGETSSTQATFPVLSGPDLAQNGDADAFVAKISSGQKDDFLGTWDGQGVYYRNSDTGGWAVLATSALLIAAGDLDGEGIDDLIGIWPGQGGVWVKYSKTSTWALLSTTAGHISSGDMNGDGRADLVGTWDGQGIFYRDSISGAWVLMATPADQITAGDLDGDGVDDLIGIWAGQGGVWVKYSKTVSWAQLSSTASDIATGKMRAVDGSGFGNIRGFLAPAGGYAEGPGRLGKFLDLSTSGPGGAYFVYQADGNLVPRGEGMRALRIVGPGEPGFHWIEQKNLWPGASQDKSVPKKK